jgi:hypothetical protein
MKLGQLHIQEDGHPADEKLMEWVRKTCGYQVFCGKDRTVSKLTVENDIIGAPSWSWTEMPEREEDPDIKYEELTREQFFAMSRPTTLLVNPNNKLITFLPPLRERGEYDRRHRLGYQWLDRHASNALDWFAFQQAHKGYQTYVRDDLEKWKLAAQAAIDVGFLPDDVEIMILDGGVCQKASIQEIFQTSSLETLEGGLTPEASSLIRVIEKIYKAEQRLHKTDGAFSLHDSARAERDLLEEILNVRSCVHAVVPIKEDGSIDTTKLIFKEMDRIALLRCSRIIMKSMQHLANAEGHANQGRVGPAVASFSFFKQTLHEMMRDFPAETAMIFGDTRIESVFARLSGE